MSKTSTQSAVSPVIGVIVLVAVTVALSAVVGTFALNLGQQSTTGSSAVGTQAAVSVDEQDSTLTFRYDEGHADKVLIKQNGSIVGELSHVSDSVTINNSEETTLVGVSGSGSKAVIYTYEPHNPSATTVDSKSFFEGWEDGTMDNWTVVKGSPSIVSGGYNGSDYTYEGESGAGTKAEYTKNFTTSQKYISYFKVVDSYGDYAVVFDLQPNGERYRVNYYPSGTDNPTFSISHTNSSGASTTLASTSPSIGYGGWTKMTVTRYDNGTIDVVVADGSTTDTLSTDASNISSGGHMMIRTYTKTQVDNITVTNP